MEQPSSSAADEAQQGPARRIIGFQRDAQGDWVAHLECGHTQHVRHNPPWMNREWVTTEKGRAARIGSRLGCRKCQDADQI